MESDTIELLTHLSTLFTKKEITKDSDFHIY
jgi:ethanolamine-phosphate cytidylyltransferase